YWGCSQGVGLFPGNFFSVLLRWLWDIPGFRSTIRPLIGGWPRFSCGLHNVGAGCIRCLFGLHHFRCGILHGPLEGFGCSAVALSQWPSVIQRFLGFANYYRKFIRNFSTLVK
ncbi:unnamed protein product, partial [Staurois parvus]